jgi:hypothetical protein
MADNTITVENPRARIRDIPILIGPLRPFVRGHSLPAATREVYCQNRGIAIAVSDITSGPSYRDWFFRTATERIIGQYFEEWVGNETESEWKLAQACLHLFQRPSRNMAPIEVFALHCEPRSLEDSLQARLKRGPHVHLRPAAEPLAHAHLPLNFGHLDAVMTSMGSLTVAMQIAIQVVLNEVVKAEWR